MIFRSPRAVLIEMRGLGLGRTRGGMYSTFVGEGRLSDVDRIVLDGDVGSVTGLHSPYSVGYGLLGAASPSYVPDSVLDSVPDESLISIVAQEPSVEANAFDAQLVGDFSRVDVDSVVDDRDDVGLEEVERAISAINGSDGLEDIGVAEDRILFDEFSGIWDSSIDVDPVHQDPVDSSEAPDHGGVSYADISSLYEQRSDYVIDNADFRDVESAISAELGLGDLSVGTNHTDSLEGVVDGFDSMGLELGDSEFDSQLWEELIGVDSGDPSVGPDPDFGADVEYEEESEPEFYADFLELPEM